MGSDKILKAKRATQLIFLVCGLAIASWAPMVPLAKDRLHLNEANLGLLLLMLGFGALLMMPLTGIFINKIGSKYIILFSVISAAVILPFLLVIKDVYVMGLVLMAFGCCIGSVDVAMNSQGIQVQNIYEKPIMSSLHGLFSIGGLFGSLGLGFLIKIGLDPFIAATVISTLLIFILIFQFRFLFDHDTEKEIIIKYSGIKTQTNEKKTYQWLHHTVISLGLMSFIVFLSEGAMLDWSAVFLKEVKQMKMEFTGIGYAAFSIAMAIMRLLGDNIVEKVTSKMIVVGGSLLATAGLVLIIVSPTVYIYLLGFILLGIGAANIVPVFLSQGGRITGVSPTAAIPAITTMGYAGQLAGPAILGFVAQKSSLSIAFGLIGVLFGLIAFIYLFRTERLSSEKSIEY